MDPNANLEEQLREAQRIANGDPHADADRLAELVLALNDWIQNGGFLPAKWTRGPNGVRL